MLSKNKLVALTLALSTLTAEATVVVVGSPEASPLTRDQVANIYLGKSFAAAPLDQPDSAPIKSLFYEKATGRGLSQVKATWSRLVFTGRGRPPKELADAAAVKKEISLNPRSIGYIDSSAVDGSVKVLLLLD